MIYYIINLSINKKLLEELGLLLIDFAGQSDIFLFNNNEYRRLIIDELGPEELNNINSLIKNKWHELQILKRRREENTKRKNTVEKQEDRKTHQRKTQLKKKKKQEARKKLRAACA